MDEFLKSVACSGTDCYSWILVFLNILAVFYLVFCSFWKVTRLVKTMGFVWLAGLLVATVWILTVHTCIYTLLVTIFTAMMIVAILAVVFSKGKTESSAQVQTQTMATKEKLGSYLISETDDGRYVFALYDEGKKFIVGSKYSYATLEKAKSEVCVCRDNGMIANIDDKTGEWIKFVDYPKFEMYRESGKYYFRLSVGSKYILLQSGAYNSENECMTMLEKAKRSAVSFDVYFSSGKEKGKNFEHYKETETMNAERVAAAPATVARTAPATAVAQSSVSMRAETPKTGVNVGNSAPSAPVKSVESTPAVLPTGECKANSCSVETCREGMICGNDIFFMTLTRAELFEFVDVFIKKRYGEIKELPEYAIGGKNDEFFFKFFLYLGKCRPRVSKELMEKIYQFVVCGGVSWYKARPAVKNKTDKK